MKRSTHSATHSATISSTISATLSRLLGFALACAMVLPAGAADNFPSRPLRFIVPLTPGSASDSVTRYVAELVGKDLGQPAVVENRPGGDSVIAVQSLLNAPADGYSILMIAPTAMVINPLVNDKLPYDPREIRPLAAAIRASAVLVTGVNSPYKTFADVAAAARKTPHTVSLANYSYHYRLGGLQLQQAAGIDLNHIPYKGAAQVQTDLMGGAVDLALLDVGGALPLLRAGKLRAIAVTSKARHPELPEVPTMRESGVANYELSVWIGFGVSSKTPEPVAQKLEAALLKALGTPEFRNFAARTAYAEVLADPGKKMSAMIASERGRYGQLVKTYDISAR
ncbi:tripartite tricarboxylate transporter substrate binding protein [Cupriavidus sp. P-10]|uniref:Bug family tripartite tricarboxylate transporter substrate binding protein n=1 Tax=Cupriavidus sp. P-10 TaxID=2027911 RepID=UPI000E2F13A1|nr:tripartite tricarboxylate transporter substrate binding protein [Cupriavidus sp. P-10]BDB23944.1 tripartite tricarboxylate transporter substrate binding protein [Cupriavidus sp. P-10]